MCYHFFSIILPIAVSLCLIMCIRVLPFLFHYPSHCCILVSDHVYSCVTISVLPCLNVYYLCSFACVYRSTFASMCPSLYLCWYTCRSLHLLSISSFHFISFYMFWEGYPSAWLIFEGPSFKIIYNYNIKQ